MFIGSLPLHTNKETDLTEQMIAFVIQDLGKFELDHWQTWGFSVLMDLVIATLDTHVPSCSIESLPEKLALVEREPSNSFGLL